MALIFYPRFVMTIIWEEFLNLTNLWNAFEVGKNILHRNFTKKYKINKTDICKKHNETQKGKQKRIFLNLQVWIKNKRCSWYNGETTDLCGDRRTRTCGRAHYVCFVDDACTANAYIEEYLRKRRETNYPILIDKYTRISQ